MSKTDHKCSVCNAEQNNPIWDLECENCEYVVYSHVLCTKSLQCPECGHRLLTPMERLEYEIGGKPLPQKD